MSTSVKAHSGPGKAVESSRLRSFSRGAIVKLRLKNFLTFDSVVMYPKPQLNVIVAPNGTGKSSIVCAMCLGLGGSASLLGRAKDLSDFVKHGKTMGFVEITLYDKRLSKNPVIRRTLFADKNSSKWCINDREVPEKEVKKLVLSLNIQLDNKCMFLPQDKVVEFARMNKQELLIETERAIGPKELFKHHEELKRLQSEHSLSHDSLKRKQKELEELERQNKLLERDVERYKNKQEYLRDIKQLTFKKCWVEYGAARNDYDEKKRERKKASEKLKRIREEYQPIKERHRAQEGAVERYNSLSRDAMRAVHQEEKIVQDKKEKLVSMEDRLEEPRQELENTKHQEATRKQRIEDLQREIEGFKSALEELESNESLNPKIAEKNRRIRDIQQQISQITEEQEELRREKQQLEDVIRRADEELRQMNSVWTQRLEKLKQRDPAAVRVIKWLRENQHKFKQPILEPVCMSINILAPCYDKQVEAFFAGRDFFSFVAQNEEDMEQFLREVRDSMHLKVNVVRAPGVPLNTYRPQISLQDLRRYGFNEMLLNVVEAPEPVLCYFCQRQGLHHIPIAGKLRPDEVDRITTELKDMKSFFTQEMRYSVKKSLYRDATSTRSNELFPPRFLVASVDMRKKEALEKEIQSTKDVLVQLEQRYLELERQDRQLRSEDSKLRTEKQELRKVIDTRKSIHTNITSRERKLERYRELTYNIPEAEEKCELEIKRIQQERVACIHHLEQSIKTVITKADQSTKAILNVCTAKARVGFFLREFRQVKTRYEDAEQRVTTLLHDENTSKERASKLLSHARKVTGVSKPEDKPELLDTFRNYPDDLEAIDDRIHELRAQADLCVSTDDSVIEEYKEREKKIERLCAEITNMKSAINGREDHIENLKRKWIIPLKELMEKINERFHEYFSSHTQMECAGEVRLDPDPDVQPNFSEFDKFGVQIKVKFRDSETLQELNAQRQSGGERSISTMLYLMALQGSTSCPFRVVDEINQGMDPINERHIFNLIVKSAYEGAQYFLLSPKLLQNLEYSEVVTVHIVNNGQEMMPCESWDVEKFLS